MPKETLPAISPMIISRTFDAPRALVFAAFTEPARMKEWWGPKGAKVLAQKMDLRPGGTYHYGMDYGGGQMWGKFIYREIVPPERIVLVNYFSDEHGGVTRHPMAPTWPLENLSTFTFEEVPGGKTKLIIRWEPINATAEEITTFNNAHASMEGGWKGTFEQLEAYLKTAAS